MCLASVGFDAAGNEHLQFPGQFGGSGTPIELGVGFSNPTAEMFISSVTLVLLTAFQAANFCIAFYRLVRAFSHQRTLDTSQQEKEMEAHLFRGLGWIVAGMKLGAIETVIGFAQGGFGIVITRRILRLLSHACLIIGIVKGVDTVEDFQLYSPSSARKRRKSTLRAMIQNPRFSTFRHVGGHDFEKSPFDERRESVIKLGSPSWMRRDFVKPEPILEEEERYTPGLLSARKSTSLTFMIAPRPTVRPKGPSVRGSGSSFASAKRSPWSDSDFVDVERDDEEIDLSDLPAPIPRVGLPPRPARQRVTVHIRQDRLPILELHRLSNLSFSDFMRDPFRDQHIRARSLPDARERSDEIYASQTVSASFTRLPTYAGAPVPTIAQPVLQVPVRQSTASRYSRTASFASYDRPWSGLSAGNARQSSMPSFTQHMSYAATDPNPRASSIPSFTQRLSVASTDFDPRASRATWSENGSQPPTAMSFHAIGSPTSANMDVERSRSPTPPSTHLRIMNPSPDRRDRGVSSSTTASEVNAIALQFPGIPPRHFSQTARRSVLSQEVGRAEFVVNPDEPMPVPLRTGASENLAPTPISPATETESEPTVSRTSSGKRKSPPAPLRTKGLTDARVVNVEIEQDDDVDDDKAVAAAVSSLPTPLSAPRYASVRARSHSASRVADVPVTAVSEDDEASFDSGFREVPVVRSASLVRRGSEQERRAKLVRVKSVGQVPRRSVLASAREQSMVRDSVVVELGMIAREGEVEMRYDPVADTQV